jgi:hypothetical protein
MSQDTLKNFKVRIHMNPANTVLEVTNAAGTSLMMADLGWLAQNLLAAGTLSKSEKQTAGAGLSHLLAILEDSQAAK